MSDSPGRQHYGLTLACAAGRRARLRPAADDGRAGAAGDPGGARGLDDDRDLRAHRVPPHGLGLHPDPRPARRHVRQGAHARDRALGVRARLARLRALALDRGPDRRPRDPGHGGGRVPARLRDHPRRVPARARRDGHRADLGHVRDRRRRRARAQRRDRRQPRLRVDLLARARVHRRRDRRHVPLGSRVADQESRQDRLDRSRPAVRDPRLAARRGQRGELLGLGLAADPRAVRRGGRARRRLGRLRASPGRAPGRHRDDARAGGRDYEPHGAPRRLRNVRLLHPHPAARPDASRRAASGSGRR